MKKIILMSLFAPIMLTGCINLGNNSNDQKVAYDCSVISDAAHHEMTERLHTCSKYSFQKEKSECQEMVIKSACKPTFQNSYTTE